MPVSTAHQPGAARPEVKKVLARGYKPPASCVYSLQGTDASHAGPCLVGTTPTRLMGDGDGHLLRAGTPTKLLKPAGRNSSVLFIEASGALLRCCIRRRSRSFGSLQPRRFLAVRTFRRSAIATGSTERNEIAGPLPVDILHTMPGDDLDAVTCFGAVATVDVARSHVRSRELVSRPIAKMDTCAKKSRAIVALDFTSTAVTWRPSSTIKSISSPRASRR